MSTEFHYDSFSSSLLAMLWRLLSWSREVEGEEKKMYECNYFQQLFLLERCVDSFADCDVRWSGLEGVANDAKLLEVCEKFRSTPAQ